MVIISTLTYVSLAFPAIMMIRYVLSNIQVLPIVALYAFILIGLPYITKLFLVGLIKANSIRLSDTQFAEAYEIFKSHAAKLDLKKVPACYLLQGNGVINAFAMRFAKHDYVVLYSTVLEAAYEDGIDTVSFILGHELGHIKRRHTSTAKHFLTLPAKLIPFLGKAHSRACEFTCDNIGYSLCPDGAVHGTLILAAGKQLYKKINVKEVVGSLTETVDFSVKIYETFSSHPALIKRIASMHDLYTNDVTLKSPAYTSSHVESSEQETLLI